MPLSLQIVGRSPNLSRPGARSQGRTQGHIVHRSSWYQDGQWLSPKLSLIRPNVDRDDLKSKVFSMKWNGIQKRRNHSKTFAYRAPSRRWHEQDRLDLLRRYVVF